MQRNTSAPRVKLSKLRDIGWNLWDPIGLLDSDEVSQGEWDDENCEAFANEYDRYLVHAASQLRRGELTEKVVDYLVDIETSHMGLGESLTSRQRAEAVVEAIQAAGDSIWTWPDEQGRFPGRG
ncbi:hypothetical protein ACFO5X_14495 [Seohaeicola nanhaiensis]|uniref:Uncharacterized protein n=1 Tax=Seohaeicola nanhaiensis TaxID=1387282 RepID=A0ABV9KIL1_9RHOB